MHICPIGSSSRLRGQESGGLLVAVPSYLICLIHIISNVSGSDARPYFASAGLESKRQDDRGWSGGSSMVVSAGEVGRNHLQPVVPAVSANVLQPYQFPFQSQASRVPGRAQQQRQPLQQQPLQLGRQQVASTLAPPPPRQPAQRLTGFGLGEGARNGGFGSHNSDHSTRTPRPAVAQAKLNQLLINQHQVQQQNQSLQLLRQSNFEHRNTSPPQVFTNKQVAQQKSQAAVAYALATSRPPQLPLQAQPIGAATTKTTASATATTTTTGPPAKQTETVYGPSDVIRLGALFSCLGCDPRAWHPLYKSLVSLQNPLLLGGDILVRTGRPIATGVGHLFKSSRSALVDPVSLWPNGIIFYELDESVAHLASLIWRVMQQFHAHTCIRFVVRPSDEPDFIRIAAHRGCSSYIGRIGGEQTLSLGEGCEYRGTIAHELLHAVGFYHHQNRSDRDDFLEILWENVAKGKEDQFRKMAAEENFLLNEFDYNSIMLYGPHTFGKTLDKITMKPKREGVILLELIEKRGLSALDIDSVNKLYKCGSRFSYDLNNPSARRR